MAYIYCADIYCDDCGAAIRDRLTGEGKAPADPSDEWSYDSDEFPKCVGDDDESDTPQHCAVGEDCINAIRIGDGDDDKVGLLFGELTHDGTAYIEDAIDEANRDGSTWSRAVVGLWYRHYTDEGYQFQKTPNWDY